MRQDRPRHLSMKKDFKLWIFSSSILLFNGDSLHFGNVEKSSRSEWRWLERNRISTDLFKRLIEKLVRDVFLFGFLVKLRGRAARDRAAAFHCYVVFTSFLARILFRNEQEHVDVSVVIYRWCASFLLSFALSLSLSFSTLAYL